MSTKLSIAKGLAKAAGAKPRVKPGTRRRKRRAARAAAKTAAKGPVFGINPPGGSAPKAKGPAARFGINPPGSSAPTPAPRSRGVRPGSFVGGVGPRLRKKKAAGPVGQFRTTRGR
jgi:hypothetical protein